MKAPLVTVGIPAYNVGRFIGMTIKSIINQTFTDFEVIITDDGSADNTVEIVKSFSDSRIILIADGQNRGISYRLNQQIELACGKYFVRMDADDIMLPDRIERQVAYLASHPDVDIIGGGAIIIDDENDIIGARIEPHSIQLDFKNWMAGRGFIHPTVAGKTEIFKRLKYSTDFVGVEDRHLWMRASQSAKLIILPDYDIFYRDPLKFKLKTYLFRCKQNRRLLRLSGVKRCFGRLQTCKQLTLSYIRTILAIVLNCLHLDYIMISRRNMPVTGNSDFAKQLNAIVSEYPI